MLVFVGLKVGDRIVEVNGVNIECKKSRQVVEMIQKSGQIVCLLVVDPKTDAFYRYLKILTKRFFKLQLYLKLVKLD